MSEPLFILDTNAAIYLLKCETITAVFAGAAFAVSVITRMELLSKRNITAGDEVEIRSFINDVDVIPINEEVETAVIALRRSSLLKLPDAIIAATSIVLNAPLLTHDEKLLNLQWPGFRVQDIY